MARQIPADVRALIESDLRRGVLRVGEIARRRAVTISDVEAIQLGMVPAKVAEALRPTPAQRTDGLTIEERRQCQAWARVSSLPPGVGVVSQATREAWEAAGRPSASEPTWCASEGCDLRAGHDGPCVPAKSVRVDAPQTPAPVIGGEAVPAPVPIVEEPGESPANSIPAEVKQVVDLRPFTAEDVAASVVIPAAWAVSEPDFREASIGWRGVRNGPAGPVPAAEWGDLYIECLPRPELAMECQAVADAVDMLRAARDELDKRQLLTGVVAEVLEAWLVRPDGEPLYSWRAHVRRVAAAALEAIEAAA